MRLLIACSLIALMAVVAGCSSSTSTSTSTSSTTEEDPVAATPTSGTWDFAMTGGTGELTGSNCPTTAASFGSGGPSILTVSDDGLTASLDIDGTLLSFTQTAPGLYQTTSMEFPLQDGDGNPVTGSVYYDMTVLSESEISGGLHWDNTLGCQGNYPFTMTLQ